MVAKAKQSCPATSPKLGRPAQDGLATVDPRLADQLESPSIEIEDRVFLQRLATEIDLGGKPESADSTEN